MTELRSDNDSAVVILTVIDAEHTVVASEISDSSKDDAGLRSQLAVSCPNDTPQAMAQLGPFGRADGGREQRCPDW